MTWWRHEMETFSALLAICAGNSPVPGEFPTQRPVTWSFDVFFDLCLNKRLSKQSWGWWFETLSCPLWRHYNEMLPRHRDGCVVSNLIWGYPQSVCGWAFNLRKVPKTPGFESWLRQRKRLYFSYRLSSILEAIFLLSIVFNSKSRLCVRSQPDLYNKYVCRW